MVEIVNSTTSQATIKCLRMIFATFGLPEMMVTDNGTCFTSSQFQEFAQCNNIRHVHIVSSVPSIFEWPGRKGSVDFQVKHQETTYCRPNCHVFFSTTDSHLIPQQVLLQLKCC